MEKLLNILDNLNKEYDTNVYPGVSYIYCGGYIFKIKKGYNILTNIEKDWRSNEYEKTKKLSGVKGYVFINEDNIKELFEYKDFPKCVYSNSVIRKIYESKTDITEEEYHKILQIMSCDKYKHYDFYKFIRNDNKSLKLRELYNCIYSNKNDKTFIEINIKEEI